MNHKLDLTKQGQEDEPMHEAGKDSMPFPRNSAKKFPECPVAGLQIGPVFVANIFQHMC